MKRSRWSVIVGAGLVGLGAGCQVDEITFGVGDARTEDAFGNPVVRPFDPDESLRIYRHKIERENEDEPGGEAGGDSEEPDG